MKNIIIILFLFLSFNCDAQLSGNIWKTPNPEKFLILKGDRLNSNIWKASLAQVGSGFADGMNQAYLFHNHGQFGNIKPNEEAWKNKWAKDQYGNPIVGQERFWQSSRALVFVTDFHHATRFAGSRLDEYSALTYAIGHGAKKKKWYWYLADLGIIFASRSIGFHTSYEWIFK